MLGVESENGLLAVEFPDILQVGTGLLKGVFILFLASKAVGSSQSLRF